MSDDIKDDKPTPDKVNSSWFKELVEREARGERPQTHVPNWKATKPRGCGCMGDA